MRSALALAALASMGTVSVEPAFTREREEPPEPRRRPEPKPREEPTAADAERIRLARERQARKAARQAKGFAVAASPRERTETGASLGPGRPTK